MPKRTFTPEQKRRRVLATKRWQARQKASGRCVTCGSPRAKGDKWHCSRCRKKNRAATVAWRDDNRERYRALNRKAATKVRAKRKVARTAAGDPPRKWVRRRKVRRRSE